MRPHFQATSLLALSVCVIAMSWPTVIFGQPVRPSPRPVSPQGATRPVAIAEPVQIEAVPGTPYGFARVLLPAGQVVPESSVRLLVTNDDGRVFFPAVDVITTSPQPPDASAALEAAADRVRGNRPRIGALIERIRGAVDAARDQIDPPELVRIQFLFTGESPFQIDVSGDMNLSLEVVPSPDTSSAPVGSLIPGGPMASLKLDALRASWWEGYVAQATLQVERSDYPAIIENYLLHMLGRRFAFPIPNLSKLPPIPNAPQEDPAPTIALVAGVESLRAELHRETLNQSEILDQPFRPIPPPPAWQESFPPEVPADLPIEAIARQVPPECFYIRFGSFANFLWYQQFGESRGGDLAQLAVLRGLNYQTNARMERMLNSKTTFVGKLFGDSIISDMAIIGQDLYMQEGPTMGILFEAKNIALLRSSMQGERRTALKQFESQGATLTPMDFNGIKGSLLSTPDNQLRSFMVEHGNYLLLTTSHVMASRFVQVAHGESSLADSKAFRFARLTMPVANDYSVFIYLSSEFFRNLVSPQYQIELRRRLKAIASIEIADMATHVAKAEEGVLDRAYYHSIDDLVEGGYLPPTFQTRVDGGETLQVNGEWHDSLRGKRGSFMPIADVPLTECTPAEYDAYQIQSQFYATEWQQTDPLMLGIRRFEHEILPNVEDLIVEGYIAPLGRDKYGWLSTLLGQPVQTEIELPADDMIHVQVHLSGEGPIRRQSLDHVLFAGVKDMIPPIPGETQGLLATLRVLRSIPGYIGTWPSPGYLDRLPFGLGGGRADVQGFSRTIFGLWRWQANGFSIVSFDRSILEQCVALVRPVPSQDFAQARLFIGDLKNSVVSSFFNILSFRRAAQTTRGNLMLLDAVQTQLHIEPHEALHIAEKLLDAELQCALGGEYTLIRRQNGVGDMTTTHGSSSDTDAQFWTSTLWDASIASVDSPRNPPIGFNPERAVPANHYRVPWLEWFRGAHLHLTQLPERLVLVGRISMERMEPTPRVKESNPKAKEEKLPAMNLDMFSLPFQFFQGDKPANKNEGPRNNGPAVPPPPPEPDPSSPPTTTRGEF